MIARANTLVSIYRGDGPTDMYGDVSEMDTPHLKDVPMALTEKTRFVQTQDTTDPMVVRYVAGRLNNGTDINRDDRIKDQRTGIWYAIDDLSTPDNYSRRMDIRLEMKRIT